MADLIVVGAGYVNPSASAGKTALHDAQCHLYICGSCESEYNVDRRTDNRLNCLYADHEMRLALINIDSFTTFYKTIELVFWYFELNEDPAYSVFIY